MNATLDNFVRERAPAAAARGGEEERRGEVAEQLVAVRTDILHDAEHAIGNLFQKMYHVSRAAREGLGPYAERLAASLQELERILELVFDYVTPTELEMRRMECGRVAESLVSHLRSHGVSEASSGVVPEAAVLVDPRIIGRVLQLVARAFARRVRKGVPVELRVEGNVVSDRVEVRLTAPSVGAGVAAADVRLAFGVAGRLIELHGGELSFTEGELVRCVVSLPMARAGN